MTTLNDSEFRQVVLDAAGRMQGKLIRYTSRFFGGDEDSARDIVQHAFLQLCRTDASKRPQKIDHWLYRVCRNRAIDTQRGRKRQQTGSQQTVSMQVDACRTTFEQLSEQELSHLVRQRLALLPDSQGEAIDLWSFGMKYAAIALIMDRPESSVRVLVHRGLAKLRSDPAVRGWLSDDDSPADSVDQKKASTEFADLTGAFNGQAKSKVKISAFERKFEF